MAIKFIALVVFAAVAQASLASASKKLATEAAKETILGTWSGVFQTVCKATKDKSWSLEDARERFRSYQISGGTAYLNLAPRSKNQALRIETSAFSAAFRDAVFRSINEARKCKSYSTAKNAIENYKTQLPYEKFIADFHAMTKDTGSTTSAVKLLKELYGQMFLQAEELAASVCGGEKAIGACPTKEIIQPKIDEYVNIAFSWLHR